MVRSRSYESLRREDRLRQPFRDAGGLGHLRGQWNGATVQIPVPGSAHGTQR